jgi:hemoglobin
MAALLPPDVEQPHGVGRALPWGQNHPVAHVAIYEMSSTPNTAYELIGGEATVRAIVNRFYELMDTLPEVAAIRKMHPDDLSGPKDRLYTFLTGWLGGPPLYARKYGQPRLRAAHLPFPIASAERDQWLLCMRTAMAEHVENVELRNSLLKAIGDLADFMRNRPDPT